MSKNPTGIVPFEDVKPKQFYRIYTPEADVYSKILIYVTKRNQGNNEHGTYRELEGEMLILEDGVPYFSHITLNVTNSFIYEYDYFVLAE